MSVRRGVLLVSGLEALAALALVFGAFWCWHRGLRTSSFPPYTEGVDAQAVTYYSAPWIAAAVACGVVAGLLAVELVRRGLLARRLR